MALAPGAHLGAYEVVELLGKGGMGEVYRARDPSLDRMVAIKVLPAEVASDPERLQRFEREARALAALNHPNVATIHGFHAADASPFLVMELVEGPTLADRIAQGPIPPRQAIPLFLAIAEGLHAAHERGIVHRDLKPANIKVASLGGSAEGGRVKILDFGLAKAMAPDPRTGDPDASHSPTLTLAATRRGEILGTAAYMAPEQARGLPIDERADIWAFGVCLFEALAGHRPFQGADVSLTLAAMLTKEPDWSALPPLPGALRRLLRRCLEKDADDRLHHIADARLELRDALADAEPGAAPANAIAPGRRSTGLLWVAVAALGVIAGAVAANMASSATRADPPRPIVRSVLSAEPSAPLSSSFSYNDVAITPDGRTVIYRGAEGLYRRDVDRIEGSFLAGTEGAEDPFVSPDGAWLGFVAPPQIKKVSLSGGAPQLLCDFPIGTTVVTPRWERDGKVYFAGTSDAGMFRVAAEGGNPERLAQEGGYPQLLPDGRTLLYRTGGTPGGNLDASRIATYDLESGETRRLLEGAGRAVYLPSGYLVFTFRGGLRAVRFDPSSRQVLGEPVTVVTDLEVKSVGSTGSFAVSDEGTLVYASGTSDDELLARLVWVDREGRVDPLAAPTRGYMYPRISPSGERAVFSQDPRLGADLWSLDLDRGALSPLDRGPSFQLYPVWEPDDRHVLYGSRAESPVMEVYRRAYDGAGATELVKAVDRDIEPLSISPDARLVVFRMGMLPPHDLGLLDLADGTVAPLLADPGFDESDAAISPDGRFLAYQTNETGRWDIYVRTFPDVAEQRWVISTDGGTEPMWSADGREIYYRSGDRMMAVPIRTEPTFQAGPPEELFTGSYLTRMGRMYDVHPRDGRFLMVAPAEGDAATRAPRVILVQNWVAELKRLVPPA